MEISVTDAPVVKLDERSEKVKVSTELTQRPGEMTLKETKWLLVKSRAGRSVPCGSVRGREGISESGRQMCATLCTCTKENA